MNDEKGSASVQRESGECRDGNAEVFPARLYSCYGLRTWTYRFALQDWENERAVLREGLKEPDVDERPKEQ